MIKLMQQCQLINKQQTGREIYYSFNAEKMKEVDMWMEQFRKLWESRFSNLDDLLANHKNQQS